MATVDPAKIVIIGAGFAGLGMAIQLKRAGYDDFVILEKGDDLGGTWRDNRYPGCACDVPSPLYSFSFAPNPAWSRLFAPQEEIWAYLRRCAATYGIEPHIRYGSTARSLAWRDEARHWRVTLASGEVLTPRVVVSGAGALHVPRSPDIPGMELFRGPAFHSARWDHSRDLTGTRVAVIGTGASAVQFVPEVAERASRLYVFQRTPPWIQPRPDVALPRPLRRAFGSLPGAQRVFRHAIYWALESRAAGFTLAPRLLAGQQKAARAHLERQVADPVLRARLTPGYTIGCKRILLSSDYYPALTRPNVELVTTPIRKITATGPVTADGTAYDVDVIVYGTGFRVTDVLAGQDIVGRGGLRIQDAWADGAEAYHGVTVAGFPNLFLLLGPNTGLGHSSVVFMIESQVQHIVSCLRLLARHRARVIEVRPGAQRRFNDRLRRRLRRTVWQTGGCASWYLDEHGVNRTLWPGFTFEYWARTRRARPADYVLDPVSGRGAP